MPLTVPFTGLGCALDCLLDAPWLRTSLGCALAGSLERFGAQSAQGRTRGESSLGPFFGNVVVTGKKIPNVVGFGTFINVVGFPSSRTVSRLEAALPGGLFCAFCGVEGP